MEINNSIVTEPASGASAICAQDFVDPAFLPAPPFASTEELQQESEAEELSDASAVTHN